MLCLMDLRTQGVFTRPYGYWLGSGDGHEKLDCVFEIIHTVPCFIST